MDPAQAAFQKTFKQHSIPGHEPILIRVVHDPTREINFRKLASTLQDLEDWWDKREREREAANKKATQEQSA
jgi:hypothetical protein